MALQYPRHALLVSEERGILALWIELAVDSPDRSESPPDGTVHYLKQIQARGNRWLRVVVNPTFAPPLVVTVFFDRRLLR